MKCALGEVAWITDGKKRVGYPGPVGDYPLFLHGFAKHDAMYRSARGYVLDVFGDAEAKAATGKPVTSVEQARIRQVSTWVHDVASEVVGFCRLWAARRLSVTHATWASHSRSRGRHAARPCRSRGRW